jgi:hypothetical protein
VAFEHPGIRVEVIIANRLRLVVMFLNGVGKQPQNYIVFKRLSCQVLGTVRASVRRCLYSLHSC